MNEDDQIRVRVTLEDAELDAIEKRLKQFTSQYANQRIRINVDVANINNAMQQLDRIAQRIQQLQNSNININSNAMLTHEQLSYRLQTQRLEVLSRIRVEQERTRQAIANSNQTLTQNLNVQQRIDGEVQHTHTHMRQLNQQASAFGTMLQRYVSYKILSTISSSISDAYKELKSVDAELQNIRKVTDMNADAIENLGNKAYGTSAKYGRAASEYLSATTTYARAGYQEQSDELAKLSMLTMNVGDVNEETASKMLIASDAAWKYKGNITELTKVIDGMNSVTNNSASDMEALSEAMTVSGQVAAQAGLSAQEWISMAATGIATTQRSGSEVARGLRTVLMNIRQIKGTDVETGEIIDETKLGKAESTLKAIGIDIRETVNGVQELRSPMKILDELSAKWDNLSSVQQSAIQEALANKRQSNIFTALIENWQEVAKYSDIYANSMGSAARENELYLNSWNAKLEILKANWTSFIAGIADVSIIKGGLDAISSVIKVLDTDVGRFVVQIGLLVAAMNLLNRGFTWIQTLRTFQRLNLSAEILHITAAELGLGAATRTLATTLWETAAAWAATPMGMATIAIGSIIAMSSAVDAYNRKQEENRQKIKSAADEAASATKELTDLTNSYFELSAAVKEDASQKDNLITTQDELLDKLDLEGKSIDELTEKYGSLDEAIKQTAIDRLKEQEIDLVAGVGVAQQSAMDEMTKFINQNDGHLDFSGDTAKILQDAGFDVRATGDKGSYGFFDYPESYEDVIAQLDELAAMLEYLRDESGKTSEELANDEAYIAIEAKYESLKGAVNDATTAIDNLNDNIAQQEILSALQGGELPKTAEEFEAFKEALYNSAAESKKFIGSADEINAVLDKILQKMPQFKGLFKEATDEAVNGISTLATMLSDVAGGDKQKNIKALANAYKDMAQNSVLSIDTVSDLLEQYPELEDKIITTSDGYKIEKSAIEEVIDAMLEKYRLEIEQSEQSIITQANTLEEAGKLDIEREKYDSLSEAIYNAVKMKLALISTPEYAVGKNFDAWQSDYKQYSEMLQTMDDIRERRKSLDSLKGSLYEDVFGNGDKTIRDNTKKYKDYSKKISDLDKKVNLDKTKYELDTTALSIERIDNAIKALEQTLDLTADDDYITRITTTSQQLDLARQKASMLSAEFAQLQNEKYNSADAAKELATRMQSTADEIAENQKHILEYGKNIAEYYTAALTSISSLSKAQIDQATRQIDNNIKALSEGGLVGIEFTMSPTIPKSAVEKQRQQNKTLEDELKAHYETVANMQKIALDLQYQETVEENARQREELVNSLNEIKGMLNTHNSDVQTSQKAADKATLDEEKKSNKEREAETQRFVNSEKQIVTSLNDWLKQNPIVAPSLDTSAWEQMVSKAESYVDRIKNAVSGNWTTSIDGVQTKNNIPYYNQNDYMMYKYGSGSIATSGCGPTAMAMVASALTGNKVDPVETAQLSTSKGTYVTGVGTSWDFFDKAAEKYGLKEQQIDVSNNSILNALKSGKLVIVSESGAPWTKNGHFIVATGITPDGKIMVNDPASAERSDKTWDISDVTKTAKGAWSFSKFYNGTRTFDYDGIAGETYETEYVIDKRTGAVTEVDSPTLVDTDKQAVVGVEQSKKIKKHQYRKGTIPVPNGLGKEYTYMAWDTITNMDTEEGRLIKTFGKNYDSEGYGKIGDRYALAMTSTFGNIGDAVDVYMSDGRIIRGVLAEEKSQVVTPWDKSPANEWGHKNGDRVVEWVTNWKNHDNPESNGSVLKVENLGSVFDNSDLASISDNISSIAQDTAKIATPNFKEQIRAITDKDIPSSQRTQFEGNLLDYIKQNTDIQANIDNELLSSWGKLQAYNAEQKENFKGYEQQLLDLVGSDGFVEYRTQLSQTTDSYLKELMREQTDITVKGIKQSFEQAKDIQDTILAYYYKRESEDATADELKVIRESWETQAETVQSLSDSYVSAISSYTDYVVTMADREMRAYDERALWQSKINDELERELNRTEDSGKRADIINKILDGYEKQNDIYEAAKTAAHNGVLALYDNENYTPIFREFDLESWFDAQADFTAQFENDLSRIAIITPELVPTLREVAQQVQTYKKEWLEADEAIKSNEDSIYNLNKTLTSGKIERYTKNLERLNSIDDVRMGKENALAAAMEKRNSIMQSTRKELADIKAEVDATMHTEQYLDEDIRKLIYNTEDYEKQRKDIESIQAEAERLYKRYQKDLANLNETEYFKESQITDEYNKQLDALNEKLAVSKQQLENTKKQLAYENGLKERDTRIIVGNRVVMVADPDRMYNLAKERSQAESELQNTLLTNSENENVRDTQRIAESIHQEIAAREKMVDLIGKMSDAEAELFSNMLPAIEELELFGNMLSEINVPWLNAHSREYREQFEDLPSIYKVNGYNLSYDYHAGHDIVSELSASGIISDEIAKAYDRQLETLHNLKRSTDINTAQYPTTSMYGGNQYSGKYAMNDDEILKAHRDNTISDYAAEMAEIIKQSGGNPSNREQERLRLLETLRNRKIFLEGLDYEQSDRYGGIKFLDNQADYAEALSYIEEYAKEGLEKADLRKVNEQMSRWEQLRKEKLDKLNETSEWNKENLDTVVDTMEGDGIPIEDGAIVEVDNADEIGRAVGGNINVNVSADSGGKSSSSTISQPKQKAGEIARGDYSKTGYTTSDKLKVNKYANGTDDAKPGWALTDEEGYEFKLKKLGDQYRLLKGHEKIFTADMTENLKNFSMNPPNFIQDMIDKTNTQMMNVVTTNNNNNPTTLTQTFTGDIVVPDNGKKFDEYMGSLIRQANGKSDVTKNLSRYS